MLYYLEMFPFDKCFICTVEFLNVIANIQLTDSYIFDIKNIDNTRFLSTFIILYHILKQSQMQLYNISNILLIV